MPRFSRAGVLAFAALVVWLPLRAQQVSEGDAGPASRPSVIPTTAPVVEMPVVPPERFNFKSAMLQTFAFTMVQHSFRLLDDPSLRDNLAHKPFFHDWHASYGGYDLKRWSDGDSFLVVDIAHPLQGANFSRIFLQNDPRSWVPFGKSRDYWITRLKGTAWAAAWEVQWKVGPFSETSFGNAGGWIYVPGCETSPSCLHNPKYPLSPANNTGLTDWVMTPLGGLMWVLAEDALDRFIVTPVARKHRILGGRILRACLEPSKDFAALFAGKMVWQLPQQENDFAAHTKPLRPKVASEPNPPFEHWEIGLQYTNISLPVLRAGCAGCRQFNSGGGFIFAYNLTRGFGFDGTVNLLPAQGGSRGMAEGLFGIKVGERFEHWAIFGKVRPGFIYYAEAMPGGGVHNPESLSRFAADVGGVVEVYSKRRASLRFEVGSTLVRYLSNQVDPRISPIGSLLSTQYIATQGNFQVSTSYGYRF